jgi:hypothetical protein
VAALTLATGGAWAQDGLRAPDEPSWPRWQTRLERLGPATTAQPLAAADQGEATSGARIFGDYYLFDLGSAVDGFSGGLRAAGGLSVGARGQATGMPPGIGGSGLGWRGRSGIDAGEQSMTTLPYVGIGVTGLSLRGGWGISADIGLAGYGLRPARSDPDLNAAEDVLRELRLTPVLQLGVSYAF